MACEEVGSLGGLVVGEEYGAAASLQLSDEAREVIGGRWDPGERLDGAENRGAEEGKEVVRVLVVDDHAGSAGGGLLP